MVEKQFQQQFKVYIENMNKPEHIIVKPFSARFRSKTTNFKLYPGKRIVKHGRPLIYKMQFQQLICLLNTIHTIRKP